MTENKEFIINFLECYNKSEVAIKEYNFFLNSDSFSDLLDEIGCIINKVDGRQLFSTELSRNSFKHKCDKLIQIINTDFRTVPSSDAITVTYKIGERYKEIREMYDNEKKKKNVP